MCAVNESRKNPPQVLGPAGGFRRKIAVRAPANRSARDLARLFHILHAGDAGRTSWIPGRKYREQSPGRLYAKTSILSTHLTHLKPNWCLATSLMGYPWAVGKVSPFTS